MRDIPIITEWHGGTFLIASLGLALGVAIGSALVPLINVEIFVVALAAKEPQLPWLAAGATVAIGQVSGKLLYYYAARGSLRLPAFLHRKPGPPKPLTARRARWQERTKRLREWLDVIAERCHRHPRWMAGTYGVSSLIGIPPFMATTLLAGLAKMPLPSFVAIGVTGRCIRFSVLAASPALISGGLF